MLVMLPACTKAVGSWFAPTAAVVNGSKIPEQNISRELSRVVENPQFKSQFEGSKGTLVRVEAQRQILNRLIRETVAVQEAKSLGLSVSNLEVEGRITQIANERYGSERAFFEAVKREQFSEGDVRDYLRQQILIQKALQAVTKDVKVGDEAVAQYYQQNQDQYTRRVHAAHILICANFDATQRTCTHSPQDEELSNQVAARIQQGGDFAALAKQFSIDSENKGNGGDLGWFDPQQLTPEFAQAVGGLEQGQISGAVKTPHGFHIIQMFGRSEPLEEAKASIESTLAKDRRDEAFADWLKKALGKSRIKVNPKFGRYDERSQSVVANRRPVPAETKAGRA